jgi:hypothetical protein
MKIFNLKKLNETEGKVQYQVKISKRFASLENLELGKLLERISTFQPNIVQVITT